MITSGNPADPSSHLRLPGPPGLFSGVSDPVLSQPDDVLWSKQQQHWTSQQQQWSAHLQHQQALRDHDLLQQQRQHHQQQQLAAASTAPQHQEQYVVLSESALRYLTSGNANAERINALGLGGLTGLGLHGLTSAPSVTNVPATNGLSALNGLSSTYGGFGGQMGTAVAGSVGGGLNNDNGGLTQFPTVSMLREERFNQAPTLLRQHDVSEYDDDLNAQFAAFNLDRTASSHHGEQGQRTLLKSREGVNGNYTDALADTATSVIKPFLMDSINLSMGEMGSSDEFGIDGRFRDYQHPYRALRSRSFGTLADMESHQKQQQLQQQFAKSYNSVPPPGYVCKLWSLVEELQPLQRASAGNHERFQFLQQWISLICIRKPPKCFQDTNEDFSPSRWLCVQKMQHPWALDSAMHSSKADPAAGKLYMQGSINARNAFRNPSKFLNATYDTSQH
ncbi:hypothetical protein HK104_002368 [Borealophlyctis nickersoniae]|nr:hypothetical protein HK104_002368 [Borealophlyctis nickersoniae]